MKTSNNFIQLFTIKNYVALVAVGLLTLSCSNDDDNPIAVDEEEVITTMTIELVSPGSLVTLQTRDLDGDGPNAPVLTVENLAANTTYNGSVKLLNETETPSDDITLEVAEEDDEHQIFFDTSGAVTSVTYDDEDGDGNPIGISFTLTTGEAGTGALRVTLRHEPKKPNDGTLADAGGETDIAQSFNLVIE